MEKLRAKIGSYNDISEEDLDFTLNLYETIEVSKGFTLVEAGQMVKHFYFLDQGCVYYYMYKDGKTQVLDFFKEGDLFTDLYAYLEEIPSQTYIKAIEDSVLYRIKKEDVQKSFDYSHAVERFGRLSAQEAFVKSFRRIAHFSNLSNEERYLRFLDKNPGIFQRVPQYLVASYLGLTPVGLSKIRKRLSLT